MSYLIRILDPYLDELLAALPAVALDGPKGVGKTATAQRHATSHLGLDDVFQAQAMEQDQDRLTRFESPLLIDEWQYYPPVWDRVRRAVDRDPSPGRFILTGSATPSQAPKHSGAGRIVHLRMRPLALVERELAVPTVSLAGLLSGCHGSIGGQSPLTLSDYVEEIVASGLPALRQVPPRFRARAFNGYLAEVLDRDFIEVGQVVRRPNLLRAWLTAYASATATTASYTTILEQATPGQGRKPAKATVLAWREILQRMWLLDPLEAWPDPRRHLSRIAQSPKHHLADPALAAHLRGVTAQALLTDPHPDGQPIPRPGTMLGALFESLVTLSVRACAEVAEATVHHLRTTSGDHEVDLMVTRPDGKAVALEIKTTPDVAPKDVKHLRWLQQQLGQDLLDAAIITTGSTAYRRTQDGIAIIPAALLGP